MTTTVRHETRNGVILARATQLPNETLWQNATDRTIFVNVSRDDATFRSTGVDQDIVTVFRWSGSGDSEILGEYTASWERGPRNGYYVNTADTHRLVTWSDTQHEAIAALLTIF